MERALALAEEARTVGEVPVGAVVATREGAILGEGRNETEELNDASAHAEILALRRAAANAKNWRLSDSILCVTLEPCSMCIGAIKLFRVPILVYGAVDPRAGAVGSLYDLSLDERTGPAPRVVTGVKADDASRILKEFFRSRRKG